jgi:serine/threonine protein kinase/tetratricopeptide (TPR) repeat protein
MSRQNTSVTGPTAKPPGDIAAAGRIHRPGSTSLDGRYRLLRLVGRGGMADVWRAQDRVFERDVAIKLPRLKVLPGSAERWVAAEAHTVARLSHPHLVPLLDRTSMGPIDGGAEVPALVFQYVSGRPLTAWASKPRPWSWLRNVASQILEALAYAHGRGVAHCDLKPSNILLSGEPEDPWVHLLDFGIASWVSASRAGVESMESIPVLDPSGGRVAGTLAYMAPELLEGRGADVGPWTDLYELGVVLVELLTGTPTFPGATDAAVWELRLQSRFTPPLQSIADLGVPLRRFLLRLLAPDPAQRFGWAADARRHLPPANTTDLTTSPRDFSPEETDVLDVVRRPEDRDTDPGPDVIGPNTEPGTGPVLDSARFSSYGGSGTLELAPAEDEDVALPAAWELDRPAMDAWDEGVRRPAAPNSAPFPAASYGLLAMRDSPLQGRDAEWEEGWDCLRRAAEESRPALLLVEGAQGRGKTRFARELAAVVEELGLARSHHVRFKSEGSGAEALRRLLEQVLRVSDLPSSSRPARVRRVLAEAGYPPDADLVPRLLSMLAEHNRAFRPEEEEAETAIELFRVLSRRRPLLLWLEDVDRCTDHALTTWLTRLFRAKGPLAVLVVATTRGVGAETGEALHPEWAVLRSDSRTLRLSMAALPDAAIASLLGFTAGLSPALGLEIARWAKGDPRGARQIARHMHESGRLSWTPDGFILRGDTPSTAGYLRFDAILEARARDFVQGREDPEPARTVLDLLSLVLERARYVDLVEAAGRVGLDEAGVAEIVAPLVVAAIVDVRDEGPRLVHTALAQRLRERIDIKRRMAFHRAWASTLEAAGGSGAAERLLEAARNRDACGQPGPAARDRRAAAHLLRARGEREAAYRAGARALEVVQREPGLLTPEVEADIHVLAARLEQETRDPPGTASDLAAALDMLQPMWVPLAPSVEQCRFELAHADALRRAGRMGEATEALKRALDLGRAVGSERWECRALAYLADQRRIEGDHSAAEQLAERADVIARRSKDPSLILRVLRVALPIAVARRDGEAVRRRLDRLRSLLRERAAWRDLQALWYFRGEAERIDGRTGEARQAYRTALSLGRKRGLPIAGILLHLMEMALVVGDLEGARGFEDDAAGSTPLGATTTHELRVVKAVLSAELAVRGGREAAAGAALQDAEILQQQSTVADPELVASLGRAKRSTKDLVLRRRLDALGSDMNARLNAPGRRRRRGR